MSAPPAKRLATVKYDTLIRNGRVLDPANALDMEPCDVGLLKGKVVAVGPALADAWGHNADGSAAAAEVFDATGLVVTPGLVDLHAHVFYLCTPLGVPADKYCLGRGVTTVVDAGDAGATTMPGFREFCVKQVKTRVLALLNVSMHGLASAGCSGGGTGGELDSLNQVSTKHAVECIEENRDIVVGLKVRLSADCADDGKNEHEAYARALAASAATALPLMVHHSFSTVPLVAGNADGSFESALGCPGSLKQGDIYTHLFHGFDTSIADDGGKAGPVADAVLEAKARGVVMDMGHGQGSFNWTVAEAAKAQGLVPDTISTDMHRDTCEGPCYDLPTCMSKQLVMGMSLNDVVAKATAAPAAVIGRSGSLGSLGPGREADVAVFSLDAVDVMLEDCQSQLRRCTQRLRCRAVWKGGERCEVTEPLAWPNPESVGLNRPAWERLIVRDAVAPPDAPPEMMAKHYLYAKAKSDEAEGAAAGGGGADGNAGCLGATCDLVSSLSLDGGGGSGSGTGKGAELPHDLPTSGYSEQAALACYSWLDSLEAEARAELVTQRVESKGAAKAGEFQSKPERRLVEFVDEEERARRRQMAAYRCC